MPEAPEVSIITNQLSKLLVGKCLSSITILGGRYKNSFLEGPSRIKVLNIACKGKFIYWQLEDDWFVWNTLGMTGEWSTQKTKHSGVEFSFLDGPTVYFNDIRHFGTLALIQGQNKMEAKLRTIGPDMLNCPPTVEEFAKIVNKPCTLAELLMSQKYISGVGNYIKAEALYQAELSPWRSCNSLSDQKVIDLYSAITGTLQESYQHGGCTLRNYQDVEGQKGDFSKLLKVYGKEKDPMGRPIIKETTLDKRTTWWCPLVQK